MISKAPVKFVLQYHARITNIQLETVGAIARANVPVDCPMHRVIAVMNHWICQRDITQLVPSNWMIREGKKTAKTIFANVVLVVAKTAMNLCCVNATKCKCDL